MPTLSLWLVQMLWVLLGMLTASLSFLLTQARLCFSSLPCDCVFCGEHRTKSSH